MPRNCAIEVTAYIDGQELGQPTRYAWHSGDLAWFNLAPTRRVGELVQVQLTHLMPRGDEWILATAALNLNGNVFAVSPALFRCGKDPDLLPTGVAYFAAPIWEGQYPDLRRTGTNIIHVTFRGLGST